MLCGMLPLCYAVTAYATLLSTGYTVSMPALLAFQNAPAGLFQSIRIGAGEWNGESVRGWVWDLEEN